jgi:hypothetical protein
MSTLLCFAPEQLSPVLGLPATEFVRPHEVRPNPSIEGMPKRLRLLCTPHVKR